MSMSYDYKTQKQFVFTDEGQKMLLKFRDQAREHIERSGAVCYAAITAGTGGGSWDILACVDRLVELGDLRRITPELSYAGDEVYVSNKWRYKR